MKQNIRKVIRNTIKEEVLKEKDDQTVAVYNFKGHKFFASANGVSDKRNNFYGWPIIEFLYKIGKRKGFVS